MSFFRHRLIHYPILFCVPISVSSFLSSLPSLDRASSHICLLLFIAHIRHCARTSFVCQYSCGSVLSILLTASLIFHPHPLHHKLLSKDGIHFTAFYLVRFVLHRRFISFRNSIWNTFFSLQLLPPWPIYETCRIKATAHKDNTRHKVGIDTRP